MYQSIVGKMVISSTKKQVFAVAILRDVNMKYYHSREIKNVVFTRTGEPGGLPSMGSHRVGHD